MAGKKMTIKALRLKAKNRRRLHALKVDPQVRGFKLSVEQQNLDIIRSLEAKLQKA